MVTASLDSSSPHADCGSCTSVGYRPGIYSCVGVFTKMDSNACIMSAGNYARQLRSILGIRFISCARRGLQQRCVEHISPPENSSMSVRCSAKDGRADGPDVWRDCWKDWRIASQTHGWMAGRPGRDDWRTGGWADGRTDGQSDGRTDWRVGERT